MHVQATSSNSNLGREDQDQSTIDTVLCQDVAEIPVYLSKVNKSTISLVCRVDAAQTPLARAPAASICWTNHFTAIDLTALHWQNSYKNLNGIEKVQLKLQPCNCDAMEQR